MNTNSNELNDMNANLDTTFTADERAALETIRAAIAESLAPDVQLVFGTSVTGEAWARFEAGEIWLSGVSLLHGLDGERVAAIGAFEADHSLVSDVEPERPTPEFLRLLQNMAETVAYRLELLRSGSPADIRERELRASVRALVAGRRRAALGLAPDQ